ncbi:MAG: hypothetical protein ACK587_03740 [Cyanobacteriota bacterium]
MAAPMGAGDEINFATIVPEAMNDFDGVDSFSGTTGAITLPDSFRGANGSRALPALSG